MTRTKMIKHKQKLLNQRFAYLMIMNLIIVLIIMSVAVVNSSMNVIEASGNNKSEDEIKFVIYESELNDHDIIDSSANTSNTNATVENEMPAMNISENLLELDRNIPESDKYLLAKIAMAEAEGESFKAKVHVILTILNRANPENECFPNTIKEVIFQNENGVYQFSPVMPGGRWWKVEPNEECWKAVEAVSDTQEDISNGALYFESCEGESWHSRNLEFIAKVDDMRFYK